MAEVQGKRGRSVVQAWQKERSFVHFSHRKGANMMEEKLSNYTCMYSSKKDGNSIANNYPLVILEPCPIRALFTMCLSSSLHKPKLHAWHVPPLLYNLIGQAIPKVFVIEVMIPNRCFSKLRYPISRLLLAKSNHSAVLESPSL